MAYVTLEQLNWNKGEMTAKKWLTFCENVQENEPIDYSPDEPTKKEGSMNYSTAVFLINDKVRAIKAQYYNPEDTNYTSKGTVEKNAKTLYKTLDTNIAVGDLIVVPTKTRWKMTVVKVTEVDVEVDFDSSIQVDWVVGRVDPTGFNETVTNEEQAIAVLRASEANAKKKEIQDKLKIFQSDKIKALPISSIGDSTEPSI